MAADHVGGEDGSKAALNTFFSHAKAIRFQGTGCMELYWHADAESTGHVHWDRRLVTFMTCHEVHVILTKLRHVLRTLATKPVSAHVHYYGNELWEIGPLLV